MQIILIFSCIIAVACYLVLPIADPDVWWHIVSGRWILSHGAVPHQDYWTLFGSGLPWRAYSWSNEIVFALADTYFGVEGLVILETVLAISIVTSFLIAFSKLSGKIFFSTMLASFAGLTLSSHFSLRPQSVTWILLGLILTVANGIEKRGVTLKSLLFLILLFCGWANTHVSAILPLGAVLFWLFPSESSKRNTMLLALAAAFVGTLVTPYLGGEWLTFFGTAADPGNFSRIAEFGPANILQSHTGYLILSLALVIWSRVEKPDVFSFGKLLGSASFAILGLSINKFIPIAVLFNCCLCAYAFGKTEQSRITLTVDKFEWLIEKLPKQGLSFILLCCAVVCFNSTWQHPLATRIAKRTLDFVIAKELPGPILNTFNDGGYISYRFASETGEPGTKVSLDGRTNLISADLWKQYSDALYGYESWKVYIDRVQPNTVIWPVSSALPSLLKQSGEWCEVFREGFGPAGLITLIKKGSYPACP